MDKNLGDCYSLIIILHLILEFITEHKVQNCSQFNVSEPGGMPW